MNPPEGSQPRLYRKQRDSSAISSPRVLVRIFAPPGRFRQTVRYYEDLTGTAHDMHLDGREQGISIAAVGGFLVLELDPTQPDRVEKARSTAVTVVFPDLDAALEQGLALGAELVTDPFRSPVGRGARLQHPDGLIFEYLEHRPGPWDTGVSSL